MNMLRSLSSAALAAALFALAGCGGGGDDAGPPAAQPQPQPAVTRIEVGPAALLLTPGQPAQTLRARALDANGAEVNVPVVWTSSRPTEVAVDGAGRVSAVAPVGSAQVFAEVGGVRSAPVLATAVEVAAGVQLIDDAQVVGLPVPVDPAASGLDLEVETVLTGFATPPAPGSLLLGRQGLAIGGEVLQATPEGNNVRVRLRLAQGDIRRLVTRARLNETIDLRGLPLTPAPEVTALYDITQVGDEFVFTPKPGVEGFQPERVTGQGAGVPTDRARKLSIAPVPPLVKHRLGPFECEIATPVLPVSISNPGGFTIRFEPVYKVLYDENDGLRKLELGASMSVKARAALQFNVGALVNLTCEATLFRRLAPVPGWAGLLLSGDIKAGVGFEAEGSVTVPLFGAETQVELAAQALVGIECTGGPAGDCQTIGRFVPTAKSGFRFLAPGDAVGNTRSELFVFPYAFIGAKAGATLVERARIEVFTVRAGLKAETTLAPEVTQMTAPVLPGFADYRSNYKIGLLTEIAAGSINKGKTDLQALLQQLGFFKATLLKWQLAVPLATSPRGTVTVDRSTVSNGDVANFRVRLEPETAFLSLPLVGSDAARAYNVKRIRIVRTAPLEGTRTVATVEAAPDQTDFNLTWVASGISDDREGQFAAFVDTVLPTPFGLKLGPAVVSTQKLLFRGGLTGAFASVGGVGGTTGTAVSTDSVFNVGTTGSGFGSLLSPNGDAVLYSKQSDIRNPDGSFGVNIFLFNTLDGITTQLTRTGKRNNRADWSPMQDAIVYNVHDFTGRTAEVRTRTLAGADRLLLPLPGVHSSNPTLQVAWSPDGNSIAVLVTRLFEQRVVRTANEVDVFIVQPDGTGLRLPLTADLGNIGSADWSPDGRHLVLTEFVQSPVNRRQSRILLLDTQTGTSRVLTQPAFGVGSGVGSNGTGVYFDEQPKFSPDGSRVAYVRKFDGFEEPVRDDGAGLRVVRVDGQADRRVLERSVTLLGWDADGFALIGSNVLPENSAVTALIPLAGPVREVMGLPGVVGLALQRPRGANTNLTVDIAGGSRFEPAEAFTVAINVRNLSAIEATDVRAEFEVPPGWQIQQITGATGCETTLTTVVCKLDTITVESPRALLVQVVAPTVIGEHKLTARVSSLQRDSEPVNNVAEKAVNIGAQRQ
jgi:Tol biopolymer transport system component/predicted small lipoprotein YifL